jgi:hypothetical protein
MVSPETDHCDLASLPKPGNAAPAPRRKTKIPGIGLLGKKKARKSKRQQSLAKTAAAAQAAADDADDDMLEDAAAVMSGEDVSDNEAPVAEISVSAELVEEEEEMEMAETSLAGVAPKPLTAKELHGAMMAKVEAALARLPTFVRSTAYFSGVLLCLWALSYVPYLPWYVEIVIFAIVGYYSVKQGQAGLADLRVRIDKSTEEEDPLELETMDKEERALMGTFAPAWALTPDYEKTEWLNEVIESLWPHISNYVDTMVADMLKDMKAKKESPYDVLDDLSVRISLGRGGPLFNGMKAYGGELTPDKVRGCLLLTRLASFCLQTLA